MTGYKKIPALVRILLLSGLLTVLQTGAVRAASPDDEFGRFFTTPKQRERLDELRDTASDVVINVNEDELKFDDDVKTVKQQHDELTLRGVVSRTDGKNTAWINDSNSYEGDVAADITKVEEHDINSDGVEVKLPGDKKKIHLKVGEAYDTSAGKTDDIIPAGDMVK